ncbi:tetratricopeptide repeat protein [Echinicola jeungdonensis]|uniref:Tetratricopeptide repeat protein n=1 Tax=Echinicola jeungdonensis TaxID=709343 RepID=A0ABV5J5G0_9BACT|nr:tetratricopeptide repeat protein [Echinicola jeungdonensis]MDN3670867.1 tetratricopeptide repeat protein [Echinicola jeungdonensis]
MRKLILSLALVGIATTISFGQKKAVRHAERNLRKGDLKEALTDIEGAIKDPETGKESETYMIKGKILTSQFALDSTNTISTVETGRNAFDSFSKAMEMEGMDSTSKVGKEIYQDYTPGLPENLQGQGVYKLKTSSVNKGISRYEKDDLELAHEFFSLAADIDPADTSIVFNAGYTANSIEKYDAAKKYLTWLLDDPEYNKLNAYYFLIQIATSHDENPEEAYRLVKEARKEYPSDKGLSEYEIQLLLQLEKTDEAMASIKESLEKNPDDAAIRLRYGYLKEQSGDLEGALQEYVKAVETDPDFYEGNYYAGALYIDMARDIINEVNNLPDDEWEAKSDEMLAKADELYKKAIPYFTKAIEQKPDNTEVLQILYQIHTRLKNEDKAAEYDKKLQELIGPNWMEG